MSVSVQQVYEIMCRMAPPELAEGWDNVGLLVDAGTPVDGVLTTLDITPAVVEEAEQGGCQLIVSHHPVIFDGMKRLSVDNLPCLMLRKGISAICMHTNMDAAQGGINDALADMLGIWDTESFANGCGRVGWVQETDAHSLARFCAEHIGPGVHYVDAGKPIRRLAEVSGGGGSFWHDALDMGADCLVTGEANHHVALDAMNAGMSLIVAGHWATERHVARLMAERLAAELPDEISVSPALSDRDPFTYL